MAAGDQDYKSGGQCDNSSIPAFTSVLAAKDARIKELEEAIEAALKQCHDNIAMILLLGKVAKPPERNVK